MARFKHTCLKKFVTRAKYAYCNDDKNIEGTHKKYYTNRMDESDIDEMLYLITTEVFYAVPDAENCISIDGIKSTTAIKNGETLIKNISYFLGKLCNLSLATFCQDVSENAKDKSTNKDYQISLVDWHPPKKMWQSHGKVSRSRECAELLRLLQKDAYAVYDLFNSDSISVKALIKTAFDKPETFEKCNGVYKLVLHEELCNIIRAYTGVHICKNNIPACCSAIKNRLLTYIYLDPETHKYILCMGDWDIYRLCTEYSNWEVFVQTLSGYSELLYELTGILSEDDKNLIDGKISELKKPPDEASALLAEKIVSHYIDKEKKWLLGQSKEYNIINRLSENKIKLWDTYKNSGKNEIKLFFYSSEFVQHPIEIKIDLNSAIVYEGFNDYYLCNEQSKVMYILEKKKRKKIGKLRKKSA